MTAGHAFRFLMDEGVLAINSMDVREIGEITLKDNARAQDLLEYLHKNRRMSMRTVAEWTERFELEDFIKFLLELGRIRFRDVVAMYRENDEPSLVHLVSLFDKKGCNDETPGPRELYHEFQKHLASAHYPAAA
jgi:hypothetical protein